MLTAPLNAGALLLLPCVALLVCAAPHAESRPERAPDFNALESRLEQLRVRWRVPGMSAAVAREGVILWNRGFGKADVAASKAATPDTVYHLASLTKPFAATVLLQLVQEGRLDLDSPVSDYGIDLKSQGMIRVRHLLTHTSEGMPGEKYHYNGTRFGQLDKVVARASGHPFAAEVSRRILQPLGLTNTCPNPESPESCEQAGRDPAEFQRRLAQGYSPDGLIPVDYKKHFVTAAGLVSTVGDMARFSHALDDGQLLSSNMLRLAFTPAVTASGKPLPYAIGWFVQERHHVQLIWHYGWWVGDSTLIVKVPARKLTFVLFANSDGLSRKFDLGKDNDVSRSPFARAFLDAYGL